MVFSCKTSCLDPELIVSMCPRPHLSFGDCKIAWLAPELLVSMGPRPYLSFCACKTAWLAPEDKSPWVPHLTSRFVHAKQRVSIRITSVYVSQPSFVFFACKTATLGQELQVSMGPRPHLCFFCNQNSDFSTRIASLYGSQPSPVVFARKTALFGTELQVSMDPSPHLWFFHAKHRA